MVRNMDLQYALMGLAYDLNLRMDSMSESEFVEFSHSRLNRIKIQYEQFKKFSSIEYTREH